MLRLLCTTAIFALALNGCTQWHLSSTPPPPQNEYEKAVYLQEQALRQQRETTLNI